LHGHITDIQHIAEDFSDYIILQASQPIFKKKPLFLYGNSMGGAVAFNICSKTAARTLIRGVVLSSPMVKIADEMRPPALVVQSLMYLAKYFPLAQMTPLPSIAEKCFKRKDMLARALSCPLVYRRPPRLSTALAMITATNDISSRMKDLNHPVLIIHGGADVVTCPKISRALYDNCSSSDRTLRIYDGCWHSLLIGEPLEKAEEIFSDIVTWLNQRSN
jgi:caffeoylshikimate esterase